MKLYVNYLLLVVSVIVNEIPCLLINENQQQLQNYVLTSTLISSVKQNCSRIKKSLEICNYLTLFINGKVYYLCVVKNKNLVNSITRDATVIIHEKKAKKTLKLNQLNITFASGYVEAKPYSSSLTGYIHNNRFYGKIRVDYKCFYVEKINKYPILLVKHNLSDSTEDAVIYERNFESVHNNLHAGSKVVSYSIFDDFFGRKKHDNIKIKNKVENKLCSLLLVIDNSFLRLVTKYNIEESISMVLQNVHEANTIYRSTDFDSDGVPNNIGFTVRYIVVIQSEKSIFNILPKFSNVPTDANTYLDSMSRYRFLKEFCLGVAFTAQTFKNHVIGLSYTANIDMNDMRRSYSGGICERPTKQGICHNGLVVTYSGDQGMLSQMLTELTLAHEIGHSFGSNHDGSDCSGHLMASSTFKELHYKNFMFSSCSKKQIATVLEHKSFCMEDNRATFCGNGILEKDEECDCGFSLHCIEKDVCCMPKGSKSPCAVNRHAGYDCHPSQGLCCLPTCKYRNISHLGLSCINFHKKCPCSGGNDCSCGILGNCVGKSCNSVECTRIDLEECKCPKSMFNTKCQTCCLDATKKCLPARIVTEMTLQRNISILNRLKKSYSAGEIQETKNFRNICIDDICVSLSFRTFEKSDYCLYKGELGVCDDKYQCFVQDRTRRPNLKASNAGPNITSGFTCIFFVWSICTIFIITNTFLM